MRCFPFCNLFTSLFLYLNISILFDYLCVCRLNFKKMHLTPFRISMSVYFENRLTYFKKQNFGLYRLAFSQSSDLYFLSIHAILLELDHQCVHMYCLCCNETNSSLTTFRNDALSYSEFLMIIKSRGFYVLGHISNIFASL